MSGILKCRYCLSPMKGNPSNQMYRCSTTYGGCGRLSVRIAQADRWIVWAALDWARSSRTTLPAPKRDYKAEEASLRAERAKWQEGYRAGLYTLAEAQGPIRELDAKIKAVAKEAVKSKPRMNAVTKRLLDYQKMNLAQKRAFISEQITDVVVGPALSRGNQPFNPARFEVHYTDGSIVTLSRDLDPEDM
ncbi:recombinase zinc ribbon domain-containing protein [Nocardioides flavus (ex Wang et al. 2016)]|uniref:zinc ribbon domain-containing protein n=1 Tax=Nocardioides flavus (ex Wang et al. 2016) TaxID=2058780 RepID=UPI00227D793E|nr:zinc ribbon domain-containing protein [Nocardioides flavus (ex Wang et al. 2016)]